MNELYQQALLYQKQKQYAQAWSCYQKILKQNPNDLLALHGMANILYQKKEYIRAIEIYEQLLTVQSFNSDLWYRCGMAYAKLEDAKAIECFRKVLKIHPVTDIKPRQTTQLQLAKALKRDQQLIKARKLGKKLFQKNKDNISVLSLLGEIAQLEQEKEIALEYFQKIIALAPQNAIGYLNAGVSAFQLEKLELAINYLTQAQQLHPNWTKAYHELAVCHQAMGNSKQAEQFLKQALKIDAKDPDNYRKLSDYYRAQGDAKRSLDYGKKLLEILPEDREMLYHVGQSYGLLGYAEGSLPYFKKAYQVEPDAQAAYALGNTHNSLKQIEKATYWFEKTISYDAQHYAARYNLGFLRMDICDWDNRTTDIAELVATLEEHMASEMHDMNIPFLFFNYFHIPMGLHRQMNEFFAKSKLKNTALLKKQVQFLPDKKEKEILRIGYMSPDFRDHPVGRLVADLFQHHDRSKVKVYAYFLTPNNKDDYATKIVETCDVYREFGFSSTVDAAQQIYDDKIDILIDLAGHTANHRIDILALQPAPIQAHLIGYPSTTGQPFIQYYLGDKYLTPLSQQSFYTEKIWQLPSAFVGSRLPIPEITLTRRELGLPEDSFVFVGFNRPAKIEPELFQSWLNILKAVENSVLWLSEMLEKPKNNLIRFALKEGISKERLIFSVKHPYDIYLKSHQLADLFLDTWHYSAGSTAVAALSAGLPMITVIDEQNASRMGACIMAAGGLEDLICNDLKAYEKLGIQLARNPRLLEKYKRILKQSNDQILLFDNPQFVRNLEDAFQKIYELWRN